MKKILCLSLFVLCFACKEQVEINPRVYLGNVSTQLGKDKMDRSLVTFDINDMEYVSMRAGNQYHFSMTRTLDTTTFKAQAFNGGFDYSEDSSVIPK